VGLLISAVEENLGMITLAYEPALHIGKAGYERIKRPLIASLTQILYCQCASHAGIFSEAVESSRR
jgi:hypothetical protein